MALDHSTTSLSSTFTGRVASVNDRGLRLDGHESWLNVSKFNPVVLPERGETVTVVVDGKGFLRSVQGVDGGAAPQISAAPTSPLPVSGGSAVPSAPAATVRDRTITRLAVLKAAAEFAAARPQLKSGEVLKIAASWERWITRESADDDLTDAF